MDKMDRFLADCIEYTEWRMSETPIKEMTGREKDYISHCCDLCLKVMAVIAAKRGYDKYISNDNNPVNTNPIMNNATNSPVNL